MVPDGVPLVGDDVVDVVDVDVDVVGDVDDVDDNELSSGFSYLQTILIEFHKLWMKNVSSPLIHK